MKEALQAFEKLDQESVTPIEIDEIDRRYNLSPPEGGIVVRVQAKVLAGYDPTKDPWETIFQNSLSRDNLWITAAEQQAIVAGEIPGSLQQRLARFHLVDNTRGEPPMWKPSEISEINMKLSNGQVTGRVKLTTADQSRGYDAELRGEIEVVDDKVVRFDMVCLGEFWGEGTYTGNAPEGKFPLAISFTLADGNDIADSVPPQGARGWLDGYLKTN